MRYALPQPYDEIDHTADVGLVVRGADRDEALARLVLGFTAIALGGDTQGLEGGELVTIKVPPADATNMAIDVLRELLFEFDASHRLPSTCEVLLFDDDRGAEVVVRLVPFDPDAHEDITDLKAVTWHGASFEQVAGGWRVQIIFDV